jgi:hypothetical protein
MKHSWVVAAGLALAALAAPARAGPSLDWSRPATAQVGDLIRVQAGAGARLRALLPLYLLAASDAPPLHSYKLRNGAAATCLPSSLGRPHGAPHCRIATLNVRRANTVHVSFRVPRLAPGRYVYVLYCGLCSRGARGSLIAFNYPRAPVLTVVR